MDYKNFSLRLIYSIVIIFVYSIVLFTNFSHVFYLIILIYILVCFEIYNYFNKYKLLPFIYVIISFIFFYNINFTYEIVYSFNLFILIVISFDIFSYLVGNFFGKNTLTKFSPNKTIEGFIGGILISFITAVLFLYYFNTNISINIYSILFIILIILSAFIGDLIESYFKRKNNLKNSSKILPGHGGVFDRFDSFLFSIIFYSISSNLL